jgi:phosphomevalonate kinase
MLNSSKSVSRKSSNKAKVRYHAKSPIKIKFEFHKNCLARTIKYYILQNFSTRTEILLGVEMESDISNFLHQQLETKSAYLQLKHSYSHLAS